MNIDDFQDVWRLMQHIWPDADYANESKQSWQQFLFPYSMQNVLAAIEIAEVGFTERPNFDGFALCLSEVAAQHTDYEPVVPEDWRNRLQTVRGYM